MTEFLQSYGTLILLGAVLIGLFVWILRSHPQHDHSGSTEIGKQDDNVHRHGGS